MAARLALETKFETYNGDGEMRREGLVEILRELLTHSRLDHFPTSNIAHLSLSLSLSHPPKDSHP